MIPKWGRHGFFLSRNLQLGTGTQVYAQISVWSKGRNKCQGKIDHCPPPTTGPLLFTLLLPQRSCQGRLPTSSLDVWCTFLRLWLCQASRPLLLLPLIRSPESRWREHLHSPFKASGHIWSWTWRVWAGSPLLWAHLAYFWFPLWHLSLWPEQSVTGGGTREEKKWFRNSPFLYSLEKRSIWLLWPLFGTENYQLLSLEILLVHLSFLFF